MPVKKLFNFITGSCVIETEACRAADILNIFMKCKYIYWDFAINGSVCSFCIPLAKLRHFMCACADECIAVRAAQKRGLPVFAAKHRRRIGIPVGLALFFAILNISGMFVWEINITGNETLTRAQVLAELDGSGFRVGSYIPPLDLDLLHNSLLLNSDSISWISVNINGSVADVVIREIKAAPEDADTRPANIIAAADGQIEQLEIYAGQPAIKPGDTVRAGDLLVSGLIDSDRVGFRHVRASGKIYARTLRTLTVEVPFEYEKKVYTGVEKSIKSIKFFSKIVNIFIKPNNFPAVYDKIEEVQPLSFFDSVSVPVSLINERYREYTTETARRSEEETLGAAYYELQLLTDELIREAQLLKKSISTEITENAVILVCELYCLEDIAEVLPFDINTEIAEIENS